MQEIVDRLAERAGVDPPRVVWVERSVTVGVGDDRDGKTVLAFGKWWFLAANGFLCTCGHSRYFHPKGGGDRCSIEGCGCESYTDDGSDHSTLVRESLEAMLVHELAHVRQRIDGWPPGESFEAEFDADERSVEILGGNPEQLIRAIRLNAPTCLSESTTHPKSEDRILRLRSKFSP